MKKDRVRRTFSRELRLEAVRLVLDEKRAISQVARDLDVWESSVTRWVQQAKVDKAPSSVEGSLTTDERAELARLRRENRVLQQERDFLKKATAFFAKETT